MQIDRYGPAGGSDTLLVLLAPAQGSPRDFVDQGFVAMVREQASHVDVALPDIGLEQAMRQQGAQILQDEVVGPAIAVGCRKVWLAGISLGACHALHYAAKYEGIPEGVALLAPYPGTGDILLEIERAGDPIQWAAGLPEDVEHERIWWRWLCKHSRRHGARPRLDFAAGRQDRFARGQRLIAGLLPGDRICWIDGGHDWPTWRELWKHWLDQGLL